MIVIVITTLHAMLLAQAAELAVLTMWTDSPPMTMPSIKIGPAMLSAAVPSLHSYRASLCFDFHA